MNNRMCCIRIKFCTVCITVTDDISCKFNDCKLHAQAQTEERNLIGTCVFDSLQFSVNTTLSESARNQDTADVFQLLTDLAQQKRTPYDFIILDPPAFTKSRKTVRDAIRGYKEINLKAMKVLPRGGYLATCSCSHFMTDDLFRQMLRSAARDAAVSLRQIEARQQAPDHPILWNVPETSYLKFYLFQVV